MRGCNTILHKFKETDFQKIFVFIENFCVKYSINDVSEKLFVGHFKLGFI